MAEQKERQGSCHCGKVTITVKGTPISVSICHCTTCQRMNGAPFGVQSLHSTENFECNTPSDELKGFSTSKMVTRYRCPDCGSPVYASLWNGKTFAVPRSMLFQKKDSPNDSAYDPTHHMYYESRIFDVQDALPKYVATSHSTRGVLWKPSNT